MSVLMVRSAGSAGSSPSGRMANSSNGMDTTGVHIDSHDTQRQVSVGEIQLQRRVQDVQGWFMRGGLAQSSFTIARTRGKAYACPCISHKRNSTLTLMTCRLRTGLRWRSTWRHAATIATNNACEVSGVGSGVPAKMSGTSHTTVT